MVEWVGRWFREQFSGSEPPDYDLPDPNLAAYDHGLGELRVNGELQGYLASVRLEMSFPARQWWPWFVIVRTDGHKVGAFEDYGPKWLTVRELDAGYLDDYSPSGEPQVYEFSWFPSDQAATKWMELGLTEDDF